MRRLSLVVFFLLLALGVLLQIRFRHPPRVALPSPASPPAAAEPPAADPLPVAALKAALEGGSTQGLAALIDRLEGPRSRVAVLLLRDLCSQPANPELTSSILGALERIGGPESVRALHEIGRADPEIIEDAAVRVSRVSGRDAEPALLEVLDREAEKGPLAAAAVHALGRTCLRSNVPRLALIASQGKDGRVKLAAIDALGSIADPEALPTLISLLEDPEPRARRQAIRALGRIRAERAREALEEHILRLEERPSPLEESLAREAVARLRGEDPRLKR